MVEAHRQNIVEPARSEKTIPTLEEHVAAVSARMVELTTIPSANLDAEVDLVIATAGPCLEDIMTLLTYSRGCQEASFIRYLESDIGNGMLYQTLGQRCTDRALSLMAELLSGCVADGFIVTH